MSMCQSSFNHAGNNVPAEIMLGIIHLLVFVQHLVERLGIEDINTHGNKSHVGIVRHAPGIPGLFLKGNNGAVLVDFHDAVGAGLRPGHLNAGYRQGLAAGNMIQKQLGIIHLVDMIPGQNQNILLLMIPDNVQILINGISGAPVPVHLVHALLRRQQIQILVKLIPEK